MKISDTELEKAMQDSNHKNALVMQILDYARFVPSVISWQEMYDVASLAQVCRGPEIEEKLKDILGILEERRKNGEHVGKKDAPRVLVTGWECHLKFRIFHLVSPNHSCGHLFAFLIS